MRKHEFINSRLGRWQRLERILGHLESRSYKKIAENDLDEFVHLYRIACSDLARARSEQLGDDVEGYLNVIVARGHKQFHPPRPPDLRNFISFFTARFPRAVREIKWYVFTATLMFVLPIIATSWIVATNPSVAYLLSPPEQLEMLTDAYATGHHGGRSEDQDSAMAGYYINNNVGIAFRCFATGIFFGIGSAFFLIMNGIIGGAVGTYICVSGYAESFLSFVIGHGAFELTAIVLSGAAGMKLGMQLVNPGQYPRWLALKLYGPQMVTIIIGSAAMLLVAAFIEGFWSPSGAQPTVKFGVGTLLWILVILYLVMAGRGSSIDNESNPVHREGIIK